MAGLFAKKNKLRIITEKKKKKEYAFAKKELLLHSLYKFILPWQQVDSFLLKDVIIQ